MARSTAARSARSDRVPIDRAAERKRRLAEVLRAEKRVYTATRKALNRWLPQVETAVLHARGPVVAAGHSPDSDPVAINPNDAALARAAWAIHSGQILDALAATWTTQFAAGAPDTEAATAQTFRDAFLAKVSNRIHAVPDEVFDRVAVIVREGTLAGASIPQIAAEIREALSPRANLARAVLIARTESVAAYNAGALAGHQFTAEATGEVLFKEWLATNDLRTRDTHVEANGQHVPIGDNFGVGGFHGMYPGAPELPAQEACNCRCVLLVGTKDELGAGEMTEPLVADAAPAADPTADPQGLPNGWRGVVAGLDRLTGDARMLATPEGGLRTRDYPMSFTRQHVGEGVDIPIGTIDRAWIADGLLYAEGRLDLGCQDGADVARMLAEGLNNGVSIQPDEVTVEYRFYDQSGAEVAMDDAMVADPREPALAALAEGVFEAMVMSDWRLASLAYVSVPAYDEARIEAVYDYAPVSAEPSLETLTEALVAYDGDADAELAAFARAMKAAAIVAAITGATDLPVASDRKAKWDGSKAGVDLQAHYTKGGKTDWAAISRAYLWRDPKGPKDSIDQFKLPYATILDGTLTIFANGVIGLAGGHGVTAIHGVSDAERAALKRKLCQLYAQVRKVHASFPDCPFADTNTNAVVAAAGQVFHREFFDDPALDGPTPLTVDADGRVYGHVRTFGSCYLSSPAMDVCLEPPPSATGYARFHVHGARLEDGTILPVGALTFGEGHRAHGGLKASQAAYADIGTVAAKVRAGEDAYGVWVAGEVTSEYADRADDLLLSPLSGHWEPDLDIGGHLEMIAAHIVVTPGYAVRRIVATIEDGSATSLIITEPRLRPQPDEARLDAVLKRLGLDPASRVERALAKVGL